MEQVIQAAENGNNVENDGPAEEDAMVPPIQNPEKYSGETDRKRLETMERTVTEIGKAEDLFFKKLHLIAIDFPKYINDRQVSHNGVITEIAKDLVPIVGPHEMFLNDLAKISPFWDSRFPNLADVILIHIKDFGKCLPFLKHIETHRQKFKQMLCDETFAAATAQFEKEIMNQRSVFICNTFDNLLKPVFQNPNNTGITVYEQLDSIFQNLLRYKLLLQRYQSSLDPRSESEIYLTKEAVEKLDDIVEDISCELTAPKLAEICKNISEKLKNFDFDALKPGRYLVKEGEVLKQCRRKMDKRTLFLFSDTLLVSHLDFKQLWEFDLNNLEAKSEDGIERENWLQLLHPKKSIALKCDSKMERDAWVCSIRRTQNKLGKQPKEASAALWVPDKEVTMCLMAQCGDRFNAFRRKHHCRECGYAICGKCSGFALSTKEKIESSRVCPECYYELFESLTSGNAEKWKTVKAVGDGNITLTNGNQVPITKFFQPPKGGQKLRGDNYRNHAKYLVEGTIFTKHGEQYARLSSDFGFSIYRARFDPQPSEHYSLNGFSYISAENFGRVNFKLTGSENTVIQFEVEKTYSGLWKDAFDQLSSLPLFIM